MAGDGEAQSAADKLAEAVTLAPEVMSFPLELGSLLESMGREAEAIRVWEVALARSAEGDIEPTLRIQAALATAYAHAGREREAEVLRRRLRAVTRSYAAEVIGSGR